MSLDPSDIARAYQPLLMLPGAPEMTPDLWRALAGVLSLDQVTSAELAYAVVQVLRTETFWPPPAKILALVHGRREEAARVEREEASMARAIAATERGRQRERRQIEPGRVDRQLIERLTRPTDQPRGGVKKLL